MNSILSQFEADDKDNDDSEYASYEQVKGLTEVHKPHNRSLDLGFDSRLDSI